MKFIPAAFKSSAVDIAKASNAIWETFAIIDGEEVPANELDAMQVRLCRWQRRNFGDVSPMDKMDLHMALGIIEESGEALDAPEIHGDKGKLDGLGDVCVYAGQLLNGNRMAIRPVMDLADLLAAEWDGNPEAQAKVKPESLQGQLSHVVLKHDQKIRGFDKPEIWMPSLAYHVAAIMAYVKCDTYWAAAELTELAEQMIKWDNLIQRTYIEVASAVVLKRNWTTDRIAGQTPA